MVRAQNTSADRVRAPLTTATIPAELRSYPSWVLWCYVKRAGDDRATKVPFVPGEDRRARTTDSRTWRTFSAALEAYEAGQGDGLGYVFSSGDPFAGIDLDSCRDPETGTIAPWAEKIIAAVGGYAEISPSGTGVHIIVKGRAPNSKRGPVECYSERRFFTMTGQAL
jgi:putative DNA primase/helicase